MTLCLFFFFFSSRRRHTRYWRDWSSDVCSSDLIILDEATEGLAPLIRDDIWRCLTALKRAGQSILVIDKNVEALIEIADRHYVIERGRVTWTGTSRELAAAPDVQHRYLGI